MSDAHITGLDAVQLDGTVGQSLVRVETDAGIAGYGEAGADGPTVRGQLRQLEELLIGEDPVEVERHYDRMTGTQHTYRPHVPTVSGVDIALWDLAGKLLDRPVSRLLTGRFRETVPLYVNTAPRDLLDPAACEAWAEELLEGTTPSAVKLTLDSAAERVSGRTVEAGVRNDTLSSAEIRAIGRAADHVRAALGDDLDFIVHCHNEWDLPTAAGIAEAVAPADPLWLEDPLPVDHAESWASLRAESSVPVLTGEKLERVREFVPFVEGGADLLQPDLAFAGGITGCRRIARRAEENHLPVTAHNVGSLLQNAATAHFGASVRNFWMTETRLPQVELFDEMGDAPGLTVEEGALTVPDAPGLGVTLDGDVLRANLLDDEPFWD